MYLVIGDRPKRNSRESVGNAGARARRHKGRDKTYQERQHGDLWERRYQRKLWTLDHGRETYDGGTAKSTRSVGVVRAPPHGDDERGEREGNNSHLHPVTATHPSKYLNPWFSPSSLSRSVPSRRYQKEVREEEEREEGGGALLPFCSDVKKPRRVMPDWCGADKLRSLNRCGCGLPRDFSMVLEDDQYPQVCMWRGRPESKSSSITGWRERRRKKKHQKRSKSTVTNSA